MLNRTTAALCLLATGTLSGCGPSEDRIRTVVREELSRALERSTLRDAKTIGPYSPAQRVGGFLFASGQIAIDQATGELVAGDIETETRQALGNLFSILRSAGYDSSDVISTTVYLRDIADYPKMNRIYGGYFPEESYPARTTVQVAALPRDARVEITAIAYRHMLK